MELVDETYFYMLLFEFSARLKTDFEKTISSIITPDTI